MSERFRSSQIALHKMSNGDYAVTYLIDISKKDGPPEWRLEGIYFFSGKTIQSKDLKQLEGDRNIYGKTVKQSEIRLDNEISWERGLACFSCCSNYSHYPITKYAPYRTNEQLSVVYLSDEPIRQVYVEPSAECIGKGGWQRFKDKFYYQQVFEVVPIVPQGRDRSRQNEKGVSLLKLTYLKPQPKIAKAKSTILFRITIRLPAEEL